MPLQQPADFGTEADSTKSEEYCSYCYQDGAFKSDVTMEQMADIAARGMSEAVGTVEAQARHRLRRILPGLKRWRSAV